MAAMPRERSVGGTEICGLGGGLAVFKIAENLKDWTGMGPFYLVFILKTEMIQPVIEHVPVVEHSWRLW